MGHAATNFEILGIRQNASKKDIREAFEMRMNALHPWNEADADERWARQQILNRVTTAYSALTAKRHGTRRKHH